MGTVSTRTQRTVGKGTEDCKPTEVRPKESKGKRNWTELGGGRSEVKTSRKIARAPKKDPGIADKVTILVEIFRRKTKTETSGEQSKRIAKRNPQNWNSWAFTATRRRKEKIVWREVAERKGERGEAAVGEAKTRAVTERKNREQRIACSVRSHICAWAGRKTQKRTHRKIATGPAAYQRAAGTAGTGSHAEEGRETAEPSLQGLQCGALQQKAPVQGQADSAQTGFGCGKTPHVGPGETAHEGSAEGSSWIGRDVEDRGAKSTRRNGRLECLHRRDCPNHYLHLTLETSCSTSHCVGDGQIAGAEVAVDGTIWTFFLDSTQLQQTEIKWC